MMFEALFESVDVQSSLLGGLLIGTSAVLMLLFNGRIAGVCGIAFGILNESIRTSTWRWLFLLGIIFGAQVAHFLFEIPIPKPPQTSTILLVSSGLIVGFGTQLGSGCTSGHGVCGIARFSPRSIVSTVLFVSTGIVSMFIFRHILGVI